MAGDWIKIEHALSDKPEIHCMADILGIDPDAIVGKLVRLWTWCDQHTVDGNAVGVAKTLLDRITHQNGFSDALIEVGWLQVCSGSLVIPNFDRHNGQTAKARVVANRRVTKCRANSNANAVANVTPAPLQKALPEKSREEYIDTPSSPVGEAPAREDKKDVFQKPRPRWVALPAWMPEELKAAFGTWQHHLEEKGITATSMQQQGWYMDCQRNGIPKAIETIRFSISKGAKSLLWDGPISRSSTAGREGRAAVQAEVTPRPKAPKVPSKLFPDGLPEGVKQGW